MLPAPTPTRKSSSTVLTTYLASNGFAFESSSAMSFIFWSTLPPPSRLGSFLRLSNTLSTVSSFENNVAWVFFCTSFSATNPRSPSLFHSSSTFSGDKPVVALIAFMTSLSLTPILVSSQSGNNLPWSKRMAWSISSSSVFFRNLDMMYVFSSLLLVFSISS